MIDEKVGKIHLTRLMGLNFFPTEKRAQAELLRALCSSATTDICKRAVDSWLNESSDRPTPADLYRMIETANGLYQDTLSKCTICSGKGVVTVWELVTYRGKSFDILTAKTLPDVQSQEEANKFIAGLMIFEGANPDAPRQTVISAAKLCSCTRPS